MLRGFAFQWKMTHVQRFPVFSAKINYKHREVGTQTRVNQFSQRHIAQHGKSHRQAPISQLKERSVYGVLGYGCWCAIVLVYQTFFLNCVKFSADVPCRGERKVSSLFWKWIIWFHAIFKISYPRETRFVWVCVSVCGVCVVSCNERVIIITRFEMHSPEETLALPPESNRLGGNSSSRWKTHHPARGGRARGVKGKDYYRNDKLVSRSFGL